jgi:transaldolase
VWLDDLSRDRIESGNLAELVASKSIVGVTTNPSIFQAAPSKGHVYDDDGETDVIPVDNPEDRYTFRTEAVDWQS